MQQPYNSNTTVAASSAPTPILYGQAYAPDEQEPSIVRDARGLCIVVLVLSGLSSIGAILSIVESPRNASQPREGLVYAIVLLPLIIGTVASVLPLYIGLKKRVAAAWHWQIVVAILGLVFGFPFGTIIYGLILSKWFKPETKKWFGL